MAIEITSKSKIKISPFIIIGVVVCLVLGALLLSAYFYFDLSLKKMDQEMQEKEAKVEPMKKSIGEKEKVIIPIKEKIDNFSGLISKHQTSFNAFMFLEENCLPSVWFSDFKFDSDEKKIVFSGQTENLTMLEHQVDIFEQSPLLESLNLSNVSIEMDDEKGRKVNFQMELIFKTKIFRPNLNVN